MLHVNKHLDLLGMRVKDCVTGVEGVVTSVSFDLYGCIQAILNRGVDKDGKPLEPYWYDVARLRVLPGEPVMERPNFVVTAETVAAGNHGPAEKPLGCKP